MGRRAIYPSTPEMERRRAANRARKKREYARRGEVIRERVRQWKLANAGLNAVMRREWDAANVDRRNECERARYRRGEVRLRRLIYAQLVYLSREREKNGRS